MKNRDFELSFNGITGIFDTKTKDFRASACGLKDEDMLSLCVLLKAHPEIKSLNLSANFIGNEGIKIIATSIKTLTSINVSYNKIGFEGAKLLANMNLHSLDISGNQLGPEGAKAFANTNLSRLVINNNNIGDKYLKVFYSTKLTCLELRGNNITDKGIEEFANTTLASLDLSNNNIGVRGIRILADTNLNILNLEDNNIGDEEAKILSKNKTLIYVKIFGTWISEEGKTLIREASERNKILKKERKNFIDQVVCVTMGARKSQSSYFKYLPSDILLHIFEYVGNETQQPVIAMCMLVFANLGVNPERDPPQLDWKTHNKEGKRIFTFKRNEENPLLSENRKNTNPWCNFFTKTVIITTAVAAACLTSEFFKNSNN